ncbi:MAG TPA: lysoplasmalogenase [Blastocatellia bacterium]|nr:lysoplasmalogenase [Blastocatellia bacterium]
MNRDKKTKTQISLSLLILLLGALNIGALYAGNRPLVYLTKPATMLVVLSLAAVERAAMPGRYGTLIMAGLVCSLAGDIFLMLPSDQFVQGLVSFLIAHLFYIAAFRSGMSGVGPLWFVLPFCAYGFLALWLLLPGLGDMKLPVIVYLVVILTMAWQSAVRWNANRDRSSVVAFAGALLFAASDSIIAFNRFRWRFYLAEGLIMSTYFTAQWLIALSVWKLPRKTAG